MLLDCIIQEINKKLFFGIQNVKKLLQSEYNSGDNYTPILIHIHETNSVFSHEIHLNYCILISGHSVLDLC